MANEQVEILQQTRQRLIEKGWSPKGWGATSGVGPNCLYSALYYTCRDTAARKPIISKLNRLVGMPIETWNDRPGRTFEEVLDLIDRGIQEFSE